MKRPFVGTQRCLHTLKGQLPETYYISAFWLRVYKNFCKNFNGEYPKAHNALLTLYAERCRNLYVNQNHTLDIF